MTETTVSQHSGRARGCGQAVLVVLMLLWAGGFLTGAAIVGEGVSGHRSSTILVAGVLLALVGPFVIVAVLTRRRPSWQPVTGSAAVLLALIGFALLEDAARLLWPGAMSLSLRGEGAGLAAVRLVMSLSYVGLASWWVPRVAALPQRKSIAWLALGRVEWQRVLLGAALSALVILPWAATGALGDSLTSLVIALQVFCAILPRVLLVWGLVYRVLSVVYERLWPVALVVLAANALLEVGWRASGLWSGSWHGAVLNLGLAILLTELRIGSPGIFSLLPLAFLSGAGGALFTDPRDVIARGAPELQHMEAGAISALVAAGLGVAILPLGALWRRVQWRRSFVARGKWIAGVVLFVVCWSIWGGTYVLAGNPGFTNDGFLIVFDEQADLSAVAAIADRQARIQSVRQLLIDSAQHTQEPVRSELDRLGVPYRPYYIINMIRVADHRALRGHFAGWPGVAAVIVNPNVRDYPHRAPQPYPGSGQVSGELQPNLKAIHVDVAWDLGVTGQGIVVAGQDTGYEWTHPALQPHYRGWNGQEADHDYNWHDAWDDADVPFDDDGHGTHTMGIVLGDDRDGNQIGVAPGAQWIGCRNMRRGFGNPGAYAECMEFFLAPYPHGGDPFVDGVAALAPEVVNNSWACPPFEGCLADTLEPAVQALRVAGIMMVVSAGNDGPACNTAGTPPAGYADLFSVGATDNRGDITSFSSRGPVDDILKPDVSAPGDSVRSSVVGGGYGYASGTSMAAPHVAGLVALLWSANPALIGDISATELLICETAQAQPVDKLCGSQDESVWGIMGLQPGGSECACGGVTGAPNNVYGCGLIDAGAAVRAVLNR